MTDQFTLIEKALRSLMASHTACREGCEAVREGEVALTVLGEVRQRVAGTEQANRMLHNDFAQMEQRALTAEREGDELRKDKQKAGSAEGRR